MEAWGGLAPLTAFAALVRGSSHLTVSEGRGVDASRTTGPVPSLSLYVPQTQLYLSASVLFKPV